ncbi:hypothetical protein OESDEN_13278 [Oesophagostomum dentatum]|uniref:Integrase catalytic domain-containing protein n=1 Tax=Oesophagostomum dentatum TaxID=61180 RepID=A0A0B1SST3_OESDE|nr:hypothetical protein OESDEN_13278 [Oesophagostomum dentatum]
MIQIQKSVKEMKIKTDRPVIVDLRGYGCVFTCAVTRMVHLELLTGASTAAIINALRRYIARRGTPSSVTCDNAPAFKLGQKILDER